LAGTFVGATVGLANPAEDACAAAADWREEMQQCLAAVRVTPETASGRELPRFVALKFNEVNLRKGPSKQQRVQCVYRRKGMPLLVIADNNNWRRTCDSDGVIGWIETSQLVARKQVLSMADHVLRRRPAETARAVARVERQALVELHRCHEGWCLVGRSGVQGWAPADAFWGILKR